MDKFIIAAAIVAAGLAAASYKKVIRPYVFAAWKVDDEFVNDVDHARANLHARMNTTTESVQAESMSA